VTTGIYCIEHTASGRRYVGSAVNVEGRWTVHRCTLKSRNHHNSYLQNCWDKYGEAAFNFHLLEECPKEQLTLREQAWMDHYNVCDSDHGFNLQPMARSPLGSKMSLETLAKMSESAKKRNSDPIYKEKLRERVREQWASGNLHIVERTEAFRAKLSAGIKASEKMKAARASLEMRAKMSASAKARHVREKALWGESHAERNVREARERRQNQS
jgi:group I intron endonuclease